MSSMKPHRCHSYNVGVGALQAIAVRPSHTTTDRHGQDQDRLVVVACASSLKMINISSLNPESVTISNISFSELDSLCVRATGGGQGSFTISDVAWNNLTSNKIGASGECNNTSNSQCHDLYTQVIRISAG